MSTTSGHGAIPGEAPAATARGVRRTPVTIPIGGGKGGVGKTFVVANLAASLARAGWRVVAADADLEGANLHTCVGVLDPGPTLADFVAGRSDDVASLLVDTPVANLRILAATHGNLAAPQPSQADRVRLMRQPLPDTTLTPNQSVTFSVIAAGTTPLTYQWRRNAINLADGPSPGGGVIIGSDTNALIVKTPGPLDTGAAPTWSLGIVPRGPSDVWSQRASPRRRST